MNRSTGFSIQMVSAHCFFLAAFPVLLQGQFNFTSTFTFIKLVKPVRHHTTGSPSSKYEHRRTWASLRNILNIRICMRKKPIVSVTQENERISKKNSLPYMKCVLRLSCVVHGPIYGHFIGCTVNCGFLSMYKVYPFNGHKSYHGLHRRDVTDI